MAVGAYYEQNQSKLAKLSESDWRVALKKCKDHITWKLNQKTLSGAHAASRLGADAVDHYLGIAYEKLLAGDWEWKEGRPLVEQMIRITNSIISTEVEKKKTKKEESFAISYRDNENEFYDVADLPDSSEEEPEFAGKLQIIYNAVEGDAQLELLMEGVKEGMKRAEIAELLEMRPRQFDKLRERLIRKVKTFKNTRK